MPTLDRDGVAIHYDVEGEGPPVLLTHGFSATGRMWTPNLPALTRHHQVITWDLRGHGKSDAPADEACYGEAQTLDDMAALLDHLGIDQAVVGGLSLGGYMSLAFHARFPERVRALLVIDTGPGYRNAERREAWNADAHATAARIERDGAAALQGGSRERREAEHRDILGVARAARKMLTQRDSTVIDSLPGIQVPALFVVGADDAPFLAPTAYMAGKVPGAEQVVIPDAGHAVNIDQPAAFDAAVLDFLAALP